ncbi:hypothetical protein [Telluria aromaticivorans]|uniref:Uncharacterized protein n=1 Tax=Telluria aromaticivorans TaxID=2725995 RepID=A0A7Y2JVW5_9BURK|nr:hypothetical protein [Telluria aromaticivorans]NNG21997.1 hypothetical protein [Telluria aromaticivorans]
MVISKASTAKPGGAQGDRQAVQARDRHSVEPLADHHGDPGAFHRSSLS